MEGQKQAIWSERVSAGGSGYFLDVKEASNGRVFLSMAQSRRLDENNWKQERIVVFENGLESFRKAILSALDVMDREADERRRADLDEVRRIHPKAFEKWSDEDDELLRRLSSEGCSVEEIASKLGRTERAVRMRLEGRDAVLAAEGRTPVSPAAVGEESRNDEEGVSNPGSGSPESVRGRPKASRTAHPR